MHIALCTPISLDLFAPHVEHAEPMPRGFIYPFAFFLVLKLLDAGHRVTVVTSAFDVARRMSWTGKEGRLTVIATPRRHPRSYCWDVYRREVRSMCAELKQAAPDIIHAQWTYEFADAGLSSGLPCLVTARDAPWLIAWHFKRFYRLYRALYSSLWQVPRIRQFTCVSPHIQRIYQKEPFFRADCSMVVPNGLDRGVFASGPKTGVRDPQAPCFASVSGWSRLKNVQCLLRAFSHVRTRHPAATLILVGDGLGPGQAGEAWARTRALSAGVVFRGHVSYQAMLTMLAHEADVFVHTTKEESFSMATLEAMAKGVPVVGGRDSGGVPWLLDSGTAGVVVDINLPDRVAEGMCGLVEQPGQYAHVANNGYRRALECFTLDGVARQYLEAYESVLKRRRPS